MNLVILLVDKNLWWSGAWILKWQRRHDPREGFIPNPNLKLLDQVSEVMRFKPYSLRTERTYQEWIKRFLFFHGKRHPREMGPFEVERFLSDLATTRRVAETTQIYTHVMLKPGLGVRSPVDSL